MFKFYKTKIWKNSYSSTSCSFISVYLLSAALYFKSVSLCVLLFQFYFIGGADHPEKPDKNIYLIQRLKNIRTYSSDYSTHPAEFEQCLAISYHFWLVVLFVLFVRISSILHFFSLFKHICSIAWNGHHGYYLLKLDKTQKLRVSRLWNYSL